MSKIHFSQTELRYRRLFETTRIGILILHCKTRLITDANPFIIKLSGRTRKELIGKTVAKAGLFESWMTGKRIFADIEKADEAFYDNITLISKDGQRRVVELGASTFNENGETMVQCTIRDLTDRKKVQDDLYESNQRLEALMNALPVGVTFSLDADSKNIQVNPYMARKMEMEPGSKITATDKKTLITEHSYRHFSKNGDELKPKELPMQRAIRENRLVGPIEGETELPSGKRWVVEGYGAPIRDRNGKVIGAVAVNVDLTERRRAEEAEKLALLVRQEKEKLNFIADAAHELRTPLAIIRGNVDLALQKRALQEDALEAINIEVLHLTSILSDLSLLTTKEGDFRKDMSSHTVEVAKIVENVAKRHTSIAAKKSISIQVSKIPRLKIIGDEYYLSRLFTNIITDAISYGKESGHIYVSGTADKNFMKIEIKDDGIGISEKDLPRIFERFYRAEESRSKDHGGSGLGLSIVKWIAEAHGGSVGVTSKLGKGTVFTVNFPLPATK